MNVLQTIRSYGIVPVLGLKNPATAAAVAESLQAGALPLLEVTMRAPQAMDCLRIIKETYPQMLVGAGTILRSQQVDEADAAGADFLVAPGLNPKVVTRAAELGLPIVPGCSTATEIEAGMELGLSTFKFFPSENLGGLATIRQLCGPYRDISFVPTSGISLQNISDYLSYDRIAAVGGSFMAPAAMVDAEDWAGITALCQEAVRRALGFRLAHVGINGKDRSEALQMAHWFSDRFGFSVRPNEKSVFADKLIECCDSDFPGTAGHIAIGTNNADRAYAWLQRKGIPAREEFCFRDSGGHLTSFYLEEEICGFAVHVMTV